METMFTPPFSEGSASFQQRLLIFSPQIQLAMWAEEVRFYRNLLAWWLLNCKEENRPEIESIMVQLNDLQEFDLPSSKEKIGIVQRQGGNNHSRAWRSMATLRDSFYYFEQKLNNLKLKIFEGFTRFGHVQIW